MFRNYFVAGVFVMSLIVESGLAAPVAIVAHRGASAYAPENTLAAANLAWEMNADAVEIDVHLTKDGRVIVSHDANTKRTSGVDMNIPDATSEELRKLDVGSFKGEKFTGEKMPFLEEVIATVPEGKKLFIEIKCGAEVLPELKRIVLAGGKMDQMVIIGFGLDTMIAAKKVLPQPPVYWLRGTLKDEETGKFLPHDPALLVQAKEGNLDGVDMNFWGIDEAFAAATKAAGLELHAWTVDDPAEGKRLVGLGVDSITTNKPDLFELKAVKYIVNASGGCMKALYPDGQGRVRLAERETPALFDNAALCRTAVSLISPGTERGIVESSIGKDPEEIVRTGVTLGYNGAGIVEEIRGDVHGLQPGRRVAFYGGPYVFHGEYLAVPRPLLYPIPEALSFDQAAFMGLGAIALHGFRQGKCALGETCLVAARASSETSALSWRFWPVAGSWSRTGIPIESRSWENAFPRTATWFVSRPKKREARFRTSAEDRGRTRSFCAWGSNPTSP
jgi:glycerophosphoryl diester phosphodiesterase